LRDQIRRAVISVMSNIAEGFGTGTDADFVRFLSYARRSVSWNAVAIVCSGRSKLYFSTNIQWSLFESEYDGTAN